MKHVDVIIVGSGLAGLSCAVELVDHGKKVLVLESRNVIGGRTSSWKEKGMTVESGLHRFLGFYDALPGILNKVGVDINKIVFWEDEIEIRLPGTEPSAVFALAPLHKPFKSLETALLNNDFIPPLEKTKLSKFFVQGLIDIKKDPTKLDRITVADYAKEQGLDERTIYNVLVPLTEGLFFLKPNEYCAYNFFALFQPYVPKMHKSRVGAFLGGMTDVMMQPLASYIEKNGGEVRINTPVEDLIIENQIVRGVVVGREKIMAQAVVLATSLFSAQKILKKHFHSHDWFRPMLSLASMPAVTFQIELTEPSMDIDRTTFSPGTIFSSYAEQSRTTFQQSKGRISIILESPVKYIKQKPEKILQEVLADAKLLGLNLPEKNVRSFHKVTWAHDFYSYTCGTDKLRPEQQTPIEGLTLAGDYTKQEYLSTMEGAVVSGQQAAKSIISA